MPTVDDVQFDVTGWEHLESIDNRIIWTNTAGDLLTKRYNPGTPKMPGLFRTQELLQYYEHQVAASGGTLLSCDLMHVKGSAINRLLFKAPQADGRFGFIGTLTLACRNFSFSIRIQALERAGDEVRVQRALQFQEMSQPSDLDSGKLEFGESAAGGVAVTQRCTADDDVWDSEFPNHPLSRLRYELSRLLPTLQISRDVKNSVPHNA